MAKYSGKNSVSEETRKEAAAIAKGTQRPGQTKAQTKLVAQGIERGIDIYKKQHKEKLRELDRRQRRQSSSSTKATADTHQQPDENGPGDLDGNREITASRQWLPWLLLALSWTGIGAYWYTRVG